jgi:hypothetical protein
VVTDYKTRVQLATMISVRALGLDRRHDLTAEKKNCFAGLHSAEKAST